MDSWGKLVTWCLFKHVPDMLVYVVRVHELDISKNENELQTNISYASAFMFK